MLHLTVCYRPAKEIDHARLEVARQAVFVLAHIGLSIRKPHSRFDDFDSRIVGFNAKEKAVLQPVTPCFRFRGLIPKDGEPTACFVRHFERVVMADLHL